METTTTPPATITPITAILSRDERNRMINAASSGMVPAERAKRADPLDPWWVQIRMKRAQGFSLQQITIMLNSPTIGLNVTQNALRRFVTAHEKQRVKPQPAATRAPARPTAKTPA